MVATRPADDGCDALRTGARDLQRWVAAGAVVLFIGVIGDFFWGNVAGAIDLSLVSCVSGIVANALYPRQGAERARLPIRNLDVGRKDRGPSGDIQIVLEFIRAYQ